MDIKLDHGDLNIKSFLQFNADISSKKSKVHKIKL